MNKTNWSRKPSSDNISSVFIYSSYDEIEPDEKNYLGTMLNVYSEAYDAINKYRNIKRLLFASMTTALILFWIYMGVISRI
jgi:hypothetical protein